jgi:hypothetical protein
MRDREAERFPLRRRSNEKYGRGPREKRKENTSIHALAAS